MKPAIAFHSICEPGEMQVANLTRALVVLTEPGLSLGEGMVELQTALGRFIDVIQHRLSKIGRATDQSRWLLD